MTKTKKLVLAGILVALGVAGSTFYIPAGVAKLFPIQHFINVLAAVVLGPFYGVGVAFATSLIRVMLGTGSLLAFPGSMCGALLSGLLYRCSKNTIMAFVGEVIGTGIIGAILAVPIAAMFLSKTVAIFGFVVSFGLSSLAGAAISTVLILALKKTGVLQTITKLGS